MAKYIEITGREMVIVSPHEHYTMPNDIADQLIARGKAREIAKLASGGSAVLSAPVEAPVADHLVERETKKRKRGVE